MKKIYLLLLVVTTFSCVNAQRKSNFTKFAPKAGRKLFMPQNALLGGCDTLNFPVPASWGERAIYVFDNDGIIDSGYLTGTNYYGDLQKAQYFDASSTSDAYISQALIGFGVAYSSTPTKVVPVNVYDGGADSTSGPGNLLGTANLTIATIAADVAANQYTLVVFNPAIPLPASKHFFVSVDLSNLSWSTTPTPVADSLAVYSSIIDSAIGGAWELDQPGTTGSWADYPTDYGFSLGLYIHPLISANQTCASLPVHLLSFTAQQKDNSVLLNWKVTQEVNMKEYVVEKAEGNLSFGSTGTVAATNSQTDHAYSFTDANALASGSKLFYRLKQVDNDGKLTYSNIITLPVATGGLSLKVVNPFRNSVQLQINSPYAQKIQAAIYDLQGRKVTNGSEQTLVAGQNLITVPVGGLLAKGVYILNIYAGTTIYKYKILNQ